MTDAERIEELEDALDRIAQWTLPLAKKKQEQTMAWLIVLKEIQELRKQGFIFRFEKHGINVEREWETELGRNRIKRCIPWIDLYETKFSHAEALRGVLNEMDVIREKR